MIEQKEIKISNTQEERKRSLSRSRSRDKYDRLDKLKSKIIKYLQKQDISFNWNIKDTQILNEIIIKKLDDDQIITKFKQIRFHEKKVEINDGNPQLTYEQYIEKEKQFHDEQELIRAFFRMQQGREQPVDGFIRAVQIYKGKMKYQKNPQIVRVMREPKEYLESLSAEELKAMLPEAIIHSKQDIRENNQYGEYWEALIDLIQSTIQKKSIKEQPMSKQAERRINKIMSKSLVDLLKMQKSIIQTQKQDSTLNQNSKFWDNILDRIKIKKLQGTLSKFSSKFQQTHEQQKVEDSQEQQKIITSPILHSRDIIASKFIVTEQEQINERKKLAQRIFKQNFDKSVEKLQNNLSLPKNHNLLQQNIITDINATYDYIAEQILEFQRYKRLEQDEQTFNDWIPVETEGRFRDRKPDYVNRVRMAFEWNRYNQLHYTTDNPPPKTVQGYKFNVFYPHLLDKTKTPQYYLQPTETTDFAIIKFKAGPPYLDIAFRIVNREWDFSEKSGFESIFAKGILHLYFNFKKPRYRI